jgi:PKD repeat protein
MRRLAVAVLLFLFLISSAVPVTLAVPGASSAETPLEFNPGLGENDGNFDLFAQTVPLRANPIKHVVADLNNDSRNDLAVIYQGSTILDIFFADTSYNFIATPSISATFLWQPTGLAVGDMDNDGKVDLVTSLDYDGENNIAICYQNNGFSPLEPSAKYFDASLRQREVLLHDLNGDGYLDIVALHSMDDPMYEAGFSVYRSTGLNTYSLTLKSLPADIYSPNLMTMGDFNGDGRKDLVIADRTAKKVIGYRNDATTGATWTPIGPISDVVATAIMVQKATGNLMEELFMALESDPPLVNAPVIRVLRYSLSTASFSVLVDEIPGQTQVTGLTMLMNNLDGRLDLVRTSSYQHNLTIFNTPATTPMWRYTDSISSPTPAEPVSVLPSDMNSDGLTDLVVLCDSSTGAGTLTVYYHSGTAISNANDNLFVTETALDLGTVGDLNGDGSQELAFYDGTADKIFFYNFTASRFDDLMAPDGAVILDAEDLNGDGKDELVLANATSLQIWWGSDNFFTTAASTFLATSLTPRSFGFGDLDGDGDIELVIGCLGGLEVYWNDGSSSPYEVGDRFVLALPGSDVTAVRTGLFSGDGDLLVDIAIVNATSSRVEIYYQQSAPRFSSSSRLLLTAVPNVDDLVCTDLNGDGRADLATHSNDTLYLFLQFPGGYFGAPEFPTKIVPGQGIDGLAIGNLDDTGIEELALLSDNSTVMAFWYDADHVTFVAMTVQTIGAAPGLLMIASMDRDGKDDVVVHSYLSRSTSVFYQNNFPPIAQATVEGTAYHEGDDVWFNADGTTDSLSDQDLLTYRWDFGDGGTGSGNRTSHVFWDNGTYDVILNVSDPWGAWDIVTVQVTIGDLAPEANFSYSGILVEGSPLQFTDLSTSPADDIVSWIWNFGDGQWSNQTSNAPVQQTYGWNDTFTVTLTIMDEDGSTDFASYDIAVMDSSPDADFSASSYSPIEGQPVIFTDQSAFTADAIVSWSWDMGDGTWENRTTGDSFTHIYLYNGTYQVTLVVRDKDGSEDNVSLMITVQDSTPVAGFTISIISPFEGESITFTDTSTYPVNAIVSWAWDFGDGASFSEEGPVTHHYADNGSFYVTLTVTDGDGNVNTSARTIEVKDTSPIVSKLYTVGGESSYKEWDEIAFEVFASAQWDDIARYQWDFQTVTFQSDLETAFNSTDHRYNSSGTYRITVRVWDSDSYSETSIQLTITDPAPVPDFTVATNTNDREVSFSAALTLDTDNDQSWLRYRWFFGDGQQTDWSYSYLVNHTYQQDGVYSVRLEVRDDHNTAAIKTRNVTIDLLPPVISMDDPVLKAVVGEPTLIKVNVTDLVGIGSVVLEYTIGNNTRTVAMTHEGGGIYFAQIPAQNSTMELTYRIVAEDMAGHEAFTENFTLALEYEDPSLFIYTSLALLIAFLVIIIYLFLSRPIVDEVFVMYHDGTLLAHQTRRLKPGMDDEILGGMLIALQNFVRDSFKDENLTVLRRMDFGERKLLVERKDDFFIAVVLSGKRAGNAAQRMLKVLDNIEEVYAPVLKEWDGDLEKVRGIREETKPMFSRANPLDRLKRKEGEDDSI